MPKPVTNIPFAAPASAPGSASVSSPVLCAGDDRVVYVWKGQGLPEMEAPSNPLLIRSEDFRGVSNRSPMGMPLAHVAAIATSAFAAMGCSGWNDVEVALIGVVWSVATVGAWGGIVSGLNKILGWFARDRMSYDDIETYIAEGDWARIEEALLDKNGDSTKLAYMQAAVLNAFERVPPHMQLSMYKAVAIANGDPKYVIVAIDQVLKNHASLDRIRVTLADIMLHYQKKPNEDIGNYIAKVVINFELRNKQGIPDPMLVYAVALASDWKDCLMLVDILAIRIALGYTVSYSHLLSSIKFLFQKPFGRDIYEQHLAPVLEGIESFDDSR